MTQPDEAQPVAFAWNADARSRAQTRGLLMALSRDRSVFYARLSNSVPATVVTFGLIPLIQRSRLFVSSERAEWSLLIELASSLDAFVRRDDRLTALKMSAGVRLGRARFVWRVAGLLTAVLFALFVALSLVRTQASNRFALAAVCFFTLVAFASLAQLVLILAHRQRLMHWFDELNLFFSSVQRRPVDRFSSWVFLGLPAVALLTAVQCFTAWPVAVVIVLLVRLTISAHLREVRGVHLQLVERILEWIDDTGLPVEYDVVALKPDEIAAMMA